MTKKKLLAYLALVRGPTTRKRALELGDIINKYGEISKREVVDIVLSNADYYQTLFGPLYSVQPDVAVSNERVRVLGRMMNQARHKLPKDKVLGRTFKVFESVQVKGENTWTIKLALECAKNLYYRNQIKTRLSIRAHTSVAAVHLYDQYVELAKKV